MDSIAPIPLPTLALTVVAAVLASWSGASSAAPARPLALVYRGPAACSGCSQAAAALVARQPEHFRVRYIGPHERLRFSPATLRRAALYVQPGGGSDVNRAWAQLEHERGFSAALIRGYVRGGGRYLGLCMGGYLAGTTDHAADGFHLLPGDSAGYTGSAGADVRTRADTVARITWLGGRRPQVRRLFFQDGPQFVLARRHPGVRVLARYRNRGAVKRIAMLVAPYGRGRVAVSGPHPEAPAAWYAADGFPPLYRGDRDIGDGLVAALMR